MILRTLVSKEIQSVEVNIKYLKQYIKDMDTLCDPDLPHTHYYFEIMNTCKTELRKQKNRIEKLKVIAKELKCGIH
jgi:hypothetical protein